MGRIDLGRERGVNVTGAAQHGGTNVNLGGVISAVHQAGNAWQNVAHGVRHVSDSLTDIFNDLADTRNRQEMLEGRTALFDLTNEENQKIEELLRRGEFDGAGGVEKFKAYCNTSLGNIKKKFGEWTGKNVTQVSTREALIEEAAFDSKRNFAHLSGRFLAYDSDRRFNLMKSQCDQAVEDGDMVGLIEAIDAYCGGGKDKDGNDLPRYKSQEFKDNLRKEYERKFFAKDYNKRAKLIDLKYSGKEAYNRYLELAEDVKKNAILHLGSRDSELLSEFFINKGKAALAHQIEADNKKFIKSINIASESLVLISKTEEEINSAFDSLISEVKANENLDFTEKAEQINRLKKERSQAVQNFKKELGAAQIAQDENMKSDLLAMLQNAVSSPTAQIEVPESDNSYDGVFSGEKGFVSTPFEEESAYIKVSQMISSLNLKKGDKKGIKALEIARIVSIGFENPELRRGLFGKLAYKLGDENLKTFYGGLEKNVVDSALKRLFPDAVKNEEDDPAYAFFLDAVKNRMGILGESGWGATKKDFFNALENDPVIVAMVQNYKGERIIKGLSIKKIQKNEFQKWAIFEQGLDDIEAQSNANIQTLINETKKLLKK